jgi:MraZ protein
MVGMQQSASESPGQRNLARVWASGSHEVEIDRQGRMAIPSHLRDFAGLDGDVLVHGAIDRVELWNPGVWDQRVKPMEQRLTEGGGEPASG